MKTILCYGDSNTWGAIPRKHFSDIRKYQLSEKWTGVLDNSLHGNFRVIDEGLRGRTTVWDDPIEGEYKNGKRYLIPCLQSHSPIDLVILFLGTNDLKKRFSVSPQDISLGIESLISIIKDSKTGPNNTAPQILILSPPPLGKITFFSEIFEGGKEKSEKLATHYEDVAKRHRCQYYDTSKIIFSSDYDGIHLSKSNHKKLGEKVAQLVRNIFVNEDVLM